MNLSNPSHSSLADHRPTSGRVPSSAQTRGKFRYHPYSRPISCEEFNGTELVATRPGNAVGSSSSSAAVLAHMRVLYPELDLTHELLDGLRRPEDDEEGMRARNEVIIRLAMVKQKELDELCGLGEFQVGVSLIGDE